MRTTVAALLFAALALSACGSPGGSAPSPYGGAATTAPQASNAAKTPAPTGDPYVDNYGY
jgi:hypothetical protein